MIRLVFLIEKFGILLIKNTQTMQKFNLPETSFQANILISYTYEF